jgi:hypothetical protein
MKAMSRAEIVLQQMQDDYLQGNKAACPNNVAFNTVIALVAYQDCRSRWSGPDTSTDAKNWESLDQAHRVIVSFASIMAACIHPEGWPGTSYKHT